MPMMIVLRVIITARKLAVLAIGLITESANLASAWYAEA